MRTYIPQSAGMETRLKLMANRTRGIGEVCNILVRADRTSEHGVIGAHRSCLYLVLSGLRAYVGAEDNIRLHFKADYFPGSALWSR